MITRAQMPRQLRNMGGITNAVPREKYGLGSKLKDRFRKLIPNELADIAVKAAPFVAPFNPGIASLMRGIGRFDQRGSISDALKQGVATFGFGKAAGYLGGAQSGDGFFGGQTFTKEGFSEGPVGRLFQGKTPSDVPGGDKLKTPPTEARKGLDIVQRGVDFAKDKIPLLDKVPDEVAQKLLVGSITSGASALYSYFAGEFDDPQQPGETMGEYMARRNARVKQQMRMYMDSYYTPLRNPEYASLTPEQRDNFIDGIVGQTEIEGTTDYGYATGGRAGYQTGGITMANTLAENMRRNLANQAAVAQQFRQARANIPGYVEPVIPPAPKAAPIKIEEPNLPIGKPVQPPGGDVQPILPVMPDQPGRPDDVVERVLPVEPPKKVIPVEPGPGGIDNLLPDLYEKIVGPAPEQPSTPPRVVTKPVDIVDFYEEVTQPGGPADDMIFRKLPVEPDPDTPIDELVVPIMPTLPVEPRTDQDILEGYEKFKEQNPGVGMGPGLQVMIYGRLPDGTPLTFRNSAQANAFNQYLESIGQPPFERVSGDIRKITDNEEKSLSKLATGGRVGYQTGGVTMANTLAENIRRNVANQAAFQKTVNPTRDAILQSLKAATLAATPKNLTGQTTKLYHGTTKADPFGGTKFFASPDKATAAQYARSGVGYGNPLSKAPVTGKILEATVPTSQAQSLLKKGLTGTREVVLDPQAAKTLFETGKGTLKGAGSLATKAAVAGTKALPFVGGAVSLADAALRAKEGDYIGAGLGAVGAVPVLGLPALGAQVLYDQLIKKDSKKSKPETPKKDPTGYNFDSEYYRNNPSTKDFDRFKVAYAKSLGMDDKISVGSEGKVNVNFGSWDPSRTYQAYKSNKQTNYDRPFFYRSSTLSPERTAELEKQENILRSLYGAPGKGRASAAKGGMPVGIMKTNKAGVMERDYRETGGFVPVGIKEKADDVPAMLSKNEFVFTADAVRGAGNGSIEKGAQRMYNTMKNLEKRVV